MRTTHKLHVDTPPVHKEVELYSNGAQITVLLVLTLPVLATRHRLTIVIQSCTKVKRSKNNRWSLLSSLAHQPHPPTHHTNNFFTCLICHSTTENRRCCYTRYCLYQQQITGVTGEGLCIPLASSRDGRLLLAINSYKGFWAHCSEVREYSRLHSLRKNLNPAKAPEQSRGLGGNIGCKDQITNTCAVSVLFCAS